MSKIFREYEEEIRNEGMIEAKKDIAKKLLSDGTSIENTAKITDLTIEIVRSIQYADHEKHNWFAIDGDIRVPENMTTKEFLDLLEKLGLQFLGSINYSIINDSDYE